MKRIKFFFRDIKLRIRWWLSDREHIRWCKYMFRNVLYPLNVHKDYLSQYIDWNKEWKKKYGVDLENFNKPNENTSKNKV